MLTAQDIREQIAELDAEVAAIVELATGEDRELTAEEKQRVDEIQGSGEKDGLVASLSDDLERKVKLENRKKEIAAERLGEQLSAAGGDGASLSDGLVAIPQESASPFASVRIPARARTFNESNLKAFSGEHAAQEAYAMGRWFMANFLGHNKSQKWLDDNGLRNSLSTDDNSKGALFVPTEMSTAIIRLVEQYGVIRRFASPEPMGSDTKTIPVRVGGMTAHPVAETNDNNEGSNTGTKTTPTWKNVELVARKWKAWTKMSDEINEDSVVQLAEQVAIEMATAFAYAEDNAGFNGDASSAYHGIKGILNALLAGSIHTATSGNLAFSSLDLVDFENALGKLPDYPGLMPAWFISKPGYYASMHRLKMAAGGNTAVNIQQGADAEFLGLPVVFTNVLNKTLADQASTKLCVVGDLSMGMKFGDRRQMSMSLTDQRYWDEDQIGIKGTERFDENVHSTGTATEAGAIVAIQTPAS